MLKVAGEELQTKDAEITIMAPNARKVWSLYIQGAITVSETERSKFVDSLNKLQKMELTHNQKKHRQQQQQQLIKQIESSSYYQSAKTIAENFYFSEAYIVEIIFDEEGKLKKSKLKIRRSGKQGRHATPIALIKRIIGQALQIGYTAADILNALWLKIEVFKPNLEKEANQQIQSVFDYFKHPKHLNANGIYHLVKVLASFYHDNLYLTFSDEYITIPYKTHECYLVPTLNYGGEQYIHGSEGSLISALLKILNAFEKRFEKRIENKSEEIENYLSEQEQCQMHYAIYAMFDFLPLPHGTRRLKKEPKNPYKYRYPDEPIERLYHAVTNHLLFISEFYPLLFDQYEDSIKKNFLSYVTKGISEEDLLALFKKQDLSELAEMLDEKSEIKVDLEYVTLAFTNKGNQQGFAQQYGGHKNNPTKLIELLQKEINQRLVNYLPYSARSEKVANTPIQKESTLQANMESYAIDILYLGYLNCLHSQSSQAFRQFEYFKDLGLSSGEFVDAFSKTYYEEIKKVLSVVAKVRQFGF